MAGEMVEQLFAWGTLEERVDAVGKHITAKQKPAFFQLVEHKVRAMSNLYRLYFSVAVNRKMAAIGDPHANMYANGAELYYRKDKELTDAYHKLLGGKWAGMMSQTHIGYTSWQQPDKQVMPDVKRIAVPKGSIVGKNGDRITIGMNKDPNMPDAGVAIEADQFVKATGAKGLNWTVVPHLGRTGSAVTALPQGRAATTPADGVRIDYAFNLSKGSNISIEVQLVPTLDPDGRNAQMLGISLDDGQPQILTNRLKPSPNPPTEEAQRNWEKAVIENGSSVTMTFVGVAPGAHRVSLWRIDDNVVVQRLVVRTLP